MHLFGFYYKNIKLFAFPNTILCCVEGGKGLRICNLSPV